MGEIIQFPYNRTAQELPKDVKTFDTVSAAERLKTAAEQMPVFFDEMRSHITENKSYRQLFDEIISKSYELYGMNEWNFEKVFEQHGYPTIYNFYNRILNEVLEPNEREITYINSSNVSIRIDRTIDMNDKKVLLKDLNDMNNEPTIYTEGIRAYNKARKLYDQWKDKDFSEIRTFFVNNKIKYHYYCAMD